MNRILLALLLCVTCIITAVAQSYGELPATVEELLSLAEAGDSDAQFQLAETYYYDVVPPDYEAAAKWHAECAKKGDSRSQVALGIAYYLGQGVPEDIDESIRLIKMAADQNNETAQYLLGYFYYQGVGVEEDYDKAFLWMSKAAKAGDSDAERQFGSFYYLGIGTECDFETAHRWYRKAADHVMRKRNIMSRLIIILA